jgi:hypothetical protein
LEERNFARAERQHVDDVPNKNERTPGDKN